MSGFDLSTLEGQQGHYKAVRARLYQQVPARAPARVSALPAEPALQEAPQPQSSALPCPSRIIAQIAREHGMTIAAILGRRQNRSIVCARWEAIYQVAIARDDLSQGDIGRRFNLGDKSIRHAVRTHAQRNGLPLPEGWRP